MKVVMLSNTPLAGAPLEAMKCLNKYAGINVRWVALKDRYHDGRVFPADLLWRADTEAECRRIMQQADILHIHNEIFPYAQDIQKNKRLLVQVHSVPRRPSFQELSKLTRHVYTLLQPMQLREYQGLSGLPNMMDPDEYKPLMSNNRRKRIVFAPTNTWTKEIAGSKGADEVVSILEKFRESADVDIFSNLAYTENLNRKRSADILIDDVVNNTFNKTTIEGCCFGLAVITSAEDGGWLRTLLPSLEMRLQQLLTDDEMLTKCKSMSRAWIETEWHPKNLVGMYMDAYKRML